MNKEFEEYCKKECKKSLDRILKVQPVITNDKIEYEPYKSTGLLEKVMARVLNKYE